MWNRLKGLSSYTQHPDVTDQTMATVYTSVAILTVRHKTNIHIWPIILAHMCFIIWASKWFSNWGSFLTPVVGGGVGGRHSRGTHVCGEMWSRSKVEWILIMWEQSTSKSAFTPASLSRFRLAKCIQRVKGYAKRKMNWFFYRNEKPNMWRSWSKHVS